MLTAAVICCICCRTAGTAGSELLKCSGRVLNLSKFSHCRKHKIECWALLEL